MMTTIPNDSIFSNNLLRGSGENAYSNLDPSSGGIGSILNTNKSTFMLIITPIKS